MTFCRALNVAQGQGCSLRKGICSHVRTHRSGTGSRSVRSVQVEFKKAEGEPTADWLKASRDTSGDITAPAAVADENVSRAPIADEQIVKAGLKNLRNGSQSVEEFEFQQTEVAATSPEPFQDLQIALQKIPKRLFTRHDVLRVHAVSNVFLCAICIPRTLQCLYEMLFHLNTVAPMQYELPLIYFLAIMRDISSIPLAYKFRKGNTRMMFLLSTYLDFCGWSVAALLMPSYSCIPQLPAPVTTGGVIALSILLVATIAYSMKDPDENVNAVVKHCSAKERKEAKSDSELKKGAISFLYLVAIILPCWVFLQAMLPAIWGGAHFFDYMHAKYPSVEELTYDGIMVGATTGAVGVFLNTLKDRRLIDRGTMDSWQAGLNAVWVLFLMRMVASHPDGGVFFTQVASLQFWKPMPWDF